MRFFKFTPDRYFKISVESELMNEMEEDESIPTTSMEGLILELELLAQELKKLLNEDEISAPN